MTGTRHRPLPLCSVLSLCCPLLLAGLFFFLTTPQAAAFSERLCARLFTLGMLLVIGLYGLIGLGLVCAGIGLSAVGCLRRESPSWLAGAALAVNVLATVIAILYIKR